MMELTGVTSRILFELSWKGKEMCGKKEGINVKMRQMYISYIS